MRQPKTAIIIGAGYGGLALANLLAQRGVKVDIYERHQQPGGRVGQLLDNGYTFDTGPSWYLMPEIFEQYYKLFDLDASKELELIRLKPGYKVFYQHQEPITINGNVEEDADTFESIEPGAGEVLRRYVKRSKDTYNMAVNYFLYTNFQRLHELLRWPVLVRALPLLRAVSRPLDAYVSRQVSDLRLRQILEYHMVFLGSSPFEAPALYSLMSTLDFDSGVYYPKKGMYSIIENMVSIGQKLGVNYHYGVDVTSIMQKDGKATGIKTVNGQQHGADIVVSNADLHFTETKLVPKKYQTYPQAYWDKKQPGPSALLLFLGIKGKLPNLKHHNLLVVDEWAKNFESIYKTKTIPKPASMYICNPTKTDLSLAPNDTENVFVLVPLPADVSISKQQLDNLADDFIKQIGVMIDVPDFGERIVYKSLYGPDEFGHDYFAWQNGALGGPSHILSQSAIFRTPNHSRKLKNLYYVGAGTVPGIGLPMCLIGAQMTYKRIIGDRRGGPLERP